MNDEKQKTEYGRISIFFGGNKWEGTFEKKRILFEILKREDEFFIQMWTYEGNEDMMPKSYIGDATFPTLEEALNHLLTVEVYH